MEAITIYLIGYQLYRAAIFGLPYKKFGGNPLLLLLPIYGDILVLKMIQRPAWWTILFYLPVVGPIMLGVLFIETLQVFNRRSLTDFLLAIVTLGVYIPIIATQGMFTYQGPTKRGDKSGGREWSEAIVFAIVAATIIRTFAIESYTIPTSSMEKSMLIGDFLFVSKVNYGPRMPVTLIAFPLVHNEMPVIKTKSYSDLLQLDYFRFPGFAKVKHNDIVVFNYPMDTDLPVDKRTNYIKRCVGLPGDSLSVLNAQVYINGEALEFPDRAKAQLSYKVVTDGKTTFNTEMLRELNITEGGQQARDEFVFLMTEDAAQKVENLSFVKSVAPIIKPKGMGDDMIFPEGVNYGWNVDNFGAVYIPKKGATVDLSLETLPLYRRIIEVYEGHTLAVEDNEIKIDGVPVSSYTFEMNYYWMMGDNRHNSLDSRFWGFVPEDHIVGKASFIWMSFDSNGNSIGEKFRTDRLFTFVHGEGKAQSYFLYFVIALLGYLGFVQIRKRRKDAADS